MVHFVHLNFALQNFINTETVKRHWVKKRGIMLNKLIFLSLFLINVNAATYGYFKDNSQGIKDANGVINISNNEGSSENPDVSAQQGKIFVVWNDNSTGQDLIYFSKYDSLWSSPLPVSTTVGGNSPRVEAEDGNFYTIWQGVNWIYYVKYDSVWSEPLQIPGSNEGTFPDIDVKGNKMYVVWEKFDDIYFSQYDSVWAEPVNISHSSYQSVNPRIAVINDGKMHVVWQENISSSPLICEVYYAQYNGIWTEPLNISNNNSDSGRPSIVANNNFVHVVWDDDVFTTAADIFYSFYDTSWSAPLNISNSPGGSLSASMFEKNNIIHVVWYEFISDNLEIVYSQKNAGSWSQPKNISNTPGWSWFPSISGGEDSVYVVWSDNTPSNYDIYFYSFPSHSTGISENNQNFQSSFMVFQNSPNPFNSSTCIRYVLPQDGCLELVIYNLQGQLVRRLANGKQSAGIHTVNWNGRNESGRKLSSGIYFYQLKTLSGVKGTKKMLLLK
jgi:hypothetical protein